jgi:NADH-dependent peroxiredoxin subunit F
MLDASLKQQLSGYLARITQPVQIVATLDDSEAARELRDLLGEIASLSPLIALEERAPDGTVRAPSFSVSRVGVDMGIRFAGVPMGHEFTSLVLALLQAGGHPPKAEASVIEQIRGLEGDFDFEVFVSLTCQNCPDVVQAINLMAVLNPRVRATMVDGALFQAEVEAKQIMAVPSLYLNGQPFGQGRMTVEEILAKLDTGAEARRGEAIRSRAPPRRPSTPRARGSARAWSPSASVARSSTPWASRTSCRSPRPRGRSWSHSSKITSAPTMST